MNNYSNHLCIKTDNTSALAKALAVFNTDIHKITRYKNFENRLAFYRSFLFHKDETTKNTEKLPFKFSPDTMADFIFGWLNSGIKFPKSPDCDGGTSKAVEVLFFENMDFVHFYDEEPEMYNEETKKLVEDPFGNRWDIQILVRPSWIAYHK